ncbi:autotransporter outer membrane beta-barrel domain-containing protein [Xenorhabdus sp. Flor]|uniref:autotransporter family protein n=1 Tax=Xenorhabdus cabanillasii TaxID=351673 RepID=UPI0019930A72|nr:autotransporter outer membrane beta-barrel domain-containing protein [Xenorhabdus sp. Flor]MBD2813978.1 autotransporter outer membrane beta-barrel domain-containing protein [Xenorhabdus sp. Flor]
MKIYRHTVFPIALRVALFFPGISIDAIADSSCGSSNTKTIISGNETESCNLSPGENLTINKNASVDVPQGTDLSDLYGLKYSAVNVGVNNNLAPVILVDDIENNGVLQGSSGVTVTHSGSVGNLFNHGTINGTNGAVWVSGQINMLDNYGSITGNDDPNSFNSITIEQAIKANKGQYGRVDTILNRKEGSIDGISVTTSTLKTLDNYGILSQGNITNSARATFIIESGSNVSTFHNYGTVTGPNHGVLVQDGGNLENLYNYSGSQGITADQNSIQVTGQGMASAVNPHIRSSKIKQITNASLLYGKQNGIYIGDKGIVNTITNLDGGVIKGDNFSISNKGHITDGIYNSGTIDGNVELGSTRLYMSGPNATLKGNVSGSKDSVVTIGGKGAATENLDLTYTHDMNVGTVKILSGSALRLGDGHKTGSITSNIDNAGSLYFNFNTTISALNNSGTVFVGGDNKTVGRTLTIAGNYRGNNGTVTLLTMLDGDHSKTDKLVVKGSTSGTTYLVIKNVGGTGAQTTEGIRVVDVQGASDGIFHLVGDYNHKGDPVVVAGGAYAYRLYKNGTGNADGNWYLRSSLISSKPNPKLIPESARLYQAGVSVYEAYGRVLQTLNTPASLRDRIGERKGKQLDMDGFKNTAGEHSTDDNTSQIPNGVWGRMTASYGKLSPRVSTSGAGAITYNMTRAQLGIDRRFYENDQGSAAGGIFLQYSNINADVGSVHGEGNIRAHGYTIGTTSTWYGNNKFYLDGLAQVTYFGNDLNSKTARRQLGNNKSALGYALSLEAGQRFDLSPAWSLIPQAQLVFSSIDMNKFHDTFGAKVRFAQSRNMKLRVGATIDYSQKWSDNQSKDEKASNLYGLFNIRQELLGRDDAVDVANVAFHGRNDRTWGETGIGGSYSWNNSNSFVYGQTSVNTSLNNFADSYELSAKIGLRMTW